MRNLVFDKCVNREDIEAKIKKALEYDTVVEDEAAARRWFKDAGIEGDVTAHTIVSKIVHVWNERERGEEVYQVVVKEHFVDSGSCDYVYSYSIN